MHNASTPFILAALIALGIIVIGCFYLASPGRVLGSFGLKPPASDADTLAWLRLKGIRDVASGLVVLTMMLTADGRLAGIVLLVEAIIPFGDMSIILGDAMMRVMNGRWEGTVLWRPGGRENSMNSKHLPAALCASSKRKTA